MFSILIEDPDGSPLIGVLLFLKHFPGPVVNNPMKYIVSGNKVTTVSAEIEAEASTREDAVAFNELYDKWLNETMFCSSAIEIIENEHFQRIVKMKENAVPFILEKIRIKPSIIVWALYLIFEMEDKNGLSIEEASKSWLEIGRENLSI